MCRTRPHPTGLGLRVPVCAGPCIGMANQGFLAADLPSSDSEDDNYNPLLDKSNPELAEHKRLAAEGKLNFATVRERGGDGAYMGPHGGNIWERSRAALFFRFEHLYYLTIALLSIPS